MLLPLILENTTFS